MAHPITALYAVLLTPLYLVLSVRVIRARRHHGVGLGHGDHREVERRVRAHGNFAEYVPFALLLMLLAEGHGSSAMWLYGAGAALAVGRHCHAWGLSGPRASMPFRVGGMVLTFLSIGLLLLQNLLQLVTG